MRECAIELWPGRRLALFLYDGVRNAAEIRARLMRKELELALMNPEMIVGLEHVLAAAARVLFNDAHKSLATWNMHSELVFQLSDSRNIGETLKRFGLAADAKRLLVGVFDPTPEKVQFVQGLVQGDEVDLALLPTFSKPEAIQKYFRIEARELAISSLLRAVVSRVAVHDSA